MFLFFNTINNFIILLECAIFVVFFNVNEVFFNAISRAFIYKNTNILAANNKDQGCNKKHAINAKECVIESSIDLEADEVQKLLSIVPKNRTFTILM